jgi:hypothetical protein
MCKRRRVRRSLPAHMRVYVRAAPAAAAVVVVVVVVAPADTAIALHCMAGGGSIRVQWADGGSGYFFTASDVSFINNTVVGFFDSSIPTGATTLDTGGAAVVVSGRVNDSVVQVNGCTVANNTLRIVGLPRTDNAAALGALAVVVGNVWTAPVVGGTHIAVWDTVIAGNAVLAPNGTSAEGGQVGFKLLFGCAPACPLLLFESCMVVLRGL